LSKKHPAAGGVFRNGIRMDTLGGWDFHTLKMVMIGGFNGLV